MSNVERWRDSGHLERAIATASGQPAFDAAVTAMMMDDARGWRLAEMRKRRGLTQELYFSAFSHFRPRGDRDRGPGRGVAAGGAQLVGGVRDVVRARPG